MADSSQVKKILADMIKQKRAMAMKDKEAQTKRNNEDRTTILNSLSKDLVGALSPVIQDLAKNSRVSSQELKEAFKEAVQLNIPEIKSPTVTVPEIKMPDIKIPEVKMPNIKIPAIVMPDKMKVDGWLSVSDYDRSLLDNPIPVQLRDASGKPVDFNKATQVFGGGGGGKADFFTIKGYSQSAFAEMMNPDGRVKVELPSGTTGLTDTELRATPVDVKQVSGHAWSVSVVSSTGTTAGTILDGEGNYRGVFPVESYTPLEVRQVSGASDSVYITGATGTLASHLVDSDGNYRGVIPVESTTPLEVKQVSGYTDSVWVKGFDGTVGAALVDSSGVQYSHDNPMSVTIHDPTGAELDLFKEGDNWAIGGDHGLGILGIDSSSTPQQYHFLRLGQGTEDHALRIVHAADYAMSVRVSEFAASVGATILNGEGLARDSWLVSDITNSVKASLIDSTGVQYSGSNPVPFTLAASSGANTLNAVLVDSDGVGYVGANGLPIRLAGGTQNSLSCHLEDSSGVGYDGSNPMWVRVSQTGATTSTHLNDSSGVGYCGSNPLPVVLINTSSSSTFAVGVTVSDAVDDNSAPVKMGGIARTANPTAVGGGDMVSFSSDKYGRQLMRPLQVRDLIATAYVSVSNGTETSLLAASSGVYHELIWVLASNNSTVAVGVDIRAVTAGNILMHLEIPANSTTGIVTPAVPLFGAIADQSGNAWTVDLPDITGTTVYVSALFSKEA